jgi:hypothetical protein
VNHAGDDDLEDDNEGPEKAGRMSHSEGLNSIETALASLNDKGRRPIQTHYCSGAGVALPQRKGRRLRSTITNL